MFLNDLTQANGSEQITACRTSNETKKEQAAAAKKKRTQRSSQGTYHIDARLSG